MLSAPFVKHERRKNMMKWEICGGGGMRSTISRISSSILRQVAALIRKAQYQEYARVGSKGNTVRIGTFFRFYFNLEPGVLPGIRIHSFRPTKTRKSVIEASLPHHLSPLFLNICPEPVRNERTSVREQKLPV